MREYLDFQDVLLLPEMFSRLNSRSQPQLHTSENSVPLSIANMENIGTLKVAKIASARGWKTYIDKHVSIIDWRTFIKESDWSLVKNVIPTFGFTDQDFAKMKEIWYLLSEKFVLCDKTVCFDLANGHSDNFWTSTIRFLREAPFKNVIFGNLGNAETIHYLIAYLRARESFPNIKSIGLKFGIGSGSVCTTRLMTGVGAPQYSLICDARKQLEACKKENEKLFENVYIISDGGIRNPGDVTKAFVAGAHEVMMGGMFAGLTETGNKFYGSSSEESKSYKPENKYSSPEGKSVLISRNMSVEERITEIENGLRSAMTYLNIACVDDLIKDYYYLQNNVVKVRRQTDNY
jgi:GMP reductase